MKLAINKTDSSIFDSIEAMPGSYLDHTKISTTFHAQSAAMLFENHPVDLQNKIDSITASAGLLITPNVGTSIIGRKIKLHARGFTGKNNLSYARIITCLGSRNRSASHPLKSTFNDNWTLELTWRANINYVHIGLFVFGYTTSDSGMLKIDIDSLDLQLE